MARRTDAAAVVAAATLTAFLPTAFGQIFNESEPNDTKAAAQPIDITTNADGLIASIVGQSTGSSSTQTGATSLDYYRIRTAAAPGAIYRYVSTNDTPTTSKHVGSLRALSQNDGAVTGTDTSVQSPATNIDGHPRAMLWYGFGDQEETYYRITGGSTTSQNYTIDVYRSTVMPTVIPGTFSAGPISISTIGQTTVNTQILVLDSNYEVVNIPGEGAAQNNDSTIAGGFTNTTQAAMRRTLPQGTYYLALGRAFATNQFPAPDEGDLNNTVLDSADSLILIDTTASTANIGFTITDGSLQYQESNLSIPGREVLWYQFTVGPSVNIIAEGSVSPSPATAGQPIQFTVNVTPSPVLPNTVTSVTANLFDLGGPGFIGFSDDGLTNGDQVAGDNVWSLRFTPSTEQIGGVFSIPFEVRDQASRFTSGSITVVMDAAVPANDDCLGAIPLTGLDLSYTDFVPVNTASADLSVSCSSNSSIFNGVWYRYTAGGADEVLRISEIGTGTGNQDVIIAAFTGGCFGLTQVYCSTAEDQVGPLVQAGQTVYILIGRQANSASTNRGDFYSINIASQAPNPVPVNDTCATATLLDANGISEQVFIGAANDDATDLACNTAAQAISRNGVWYRYTPAADELATIARSEQNLAYGLFTGTCGNLTQLYCNQFDSPTGATLPLLAGREYYFLIAAEATDQGLDALASTFLTISFSPATTAWLGNFDCAHATEINSLSYNQVGVIRAAYYDAVVPSCEGPSTPIANYGVWYKYTPNARTQATIAEGDSTDTTLVAFSGSCDGLTEIYCEDNEFLTPRFMTLEPGNTYYFLVLYDSSTVPTSDFTDIDFTFSGTVLPPPPANDACANAAVINALPYAQQVIAGGALSDDQVSCNSGGGSETLAGVWYRWTAPSSCFLRMFEPTDTSVVFSVRTGSCAGPEVYCSALEDGVGFQTTAGTTYYILVGYQGANTPPANLVYYVSFDCAQPPAAPANDTCGTARNLTALPFSHSVPFVSAGGDVDVACNSANAPGVTHNGVWYRYQATQTGHLLASESGDRDAVWAAFTGDCSGGLSEIFCDTDESLAISVTAGTTYYVLLGSSSPTASENPGDTWKVTFDFTTGGTNDTCANATVITSLPFTSYVPLLPLTQDAGPGSSGGCRTTIHHGAWFTYTPPVGQNCQLALAETGTQDEFFVVYTGSCGSLSHIVCNGDQTPGPIPLTGGVQYWILLGRTSAGTSTSPVTSEMVFELEADCVSPPANDACANAVNITSTPFTATVNTRAATADGPPNSCEAATTTSLNFTAWYRYVPASNGLLFFDLNARRDLTLQNFSVLTGSCDPAPNGSFAQLFCSEADPGVGYLNVTAGTPYYFLLGDDISTEGGGTWDVTVRFSGACRADFDGANGVQVADIFAFLRAWFAQNPSADFDGQNGIQVADIFAFLRAWFAGCP